MMRHFILLSCIKSIPSLEKVSIMDCDKRWRVSASGVKVTEVRNDLTLPSESLHMRLELGYRANRCYVPLLELPVSSYVMKGVTLFLFERDDLREDEYDSFWKTVVADFEDKEEAVYCEAMMEIFKNRMGWIESLKISIIASQYTAFSLFERDDLLEDEYDSFWKTVIVFGRLS
ncbi:F-box domain, Leucine-rich repeat domain, L domain-like protein [Artemisia annua]|uniref:F-box domain, Leucine-rich repeat domain, L domain-like protein n=1 Tax=Artemisia annua TaxID=35608 RepID=A0A2U1L1J2_ARTAN|nr:F-box domain, Leucine-rich repeat domain, L domain-like protein [Artemisia annua]